MSGVDPWVRLEGTSVFFPKIISNCSCFHNKKLHYYNNISIYVDNFFFFFFFTHSLCYIYIFSQFIYHIRFNVSANQLAETLISQNVEQDVMNKL